MCTAMNAVAVIDSARCRRSTAARGNAVDAARPAVAMPRTTTAVNSTRETTPTARLEYRGRWRSSLITARPVCGRRAECGVRHHEPPDVAWARALMVALSLIHI